jgi:hypothetical protein
MGVCETVKSLYCMYIVNIAETYLKAYKLRELQCSVVLAVSFLKTSRIFISFAD